MITRLIAAAIFTLASTAAWAQPSDADIATYRAKLGRYVAAGYEQDAIVQGLKDWYGWVFFAQPDYTAGVIDYFVKAPVLGAEIRYMRLIGSVRISEPLKLVEQ